MIFNSLEFAIFLPVVFILYWFVFKRNLKYQNFLIVVSSYFFYGWWDWKFLGLIFFSTSVDYIIGLLLEDQEDKQRRKIFLWTSIIVNIGLLGIFKYYNFFLDSLYDLTPGLKAVMGFNSLDIILPVGISFYTFQTLSYTIDVYKGRINASRDFIAFAAFVSFFPQLVAGPIERAANLLPQFSQRRRFKYSEATDGLRQILWGLFKKVVIADNCAVFANEIFNNSEIYNGSTLVLGAIFFSFQIYGDFSGYSDIAIGTSRLFGFNLMKNFAFPYFSRDIAEFWRRWHISLSTWFRDYVYIPLGGSRGGLLQKVRNIMIIFMVSGFWHGANWTFIIWGLLNAIFFLPLLFSKRNRQHIGTVAEGKFFPSPKDILKIFLTFGLTTFGWIFFRAKDLNHAFQYISSILSPSLFQEPELVKIEGEKSVILLIGFFILVEWFGKHGEYAIEKVNLKWRPVRYSFYYIIIAAIFWFGGKEQEFIYFQF